MFQEQLNARLAVKKAAQVSLAPLEVVCKAIQNEFATSNSYLIQKDWAKWNAEKKGGNLVKNSSEHHRSLANYHKEKMQEHLKQSTASGDMHDKACDAHGKAMQKHSSLVSNTYDANRTDSIGAVRRGLDSEAMKATSAAEKASSRTGVSKEDTTELVQKDWAAWNKAHPKGNYGALLPKHEVQGWNAEADQHKTAYNNHMASAERLLSGSPERKAHSDAAVAHLQAGAHAKGVLAGTHNPETYSGSNYKAKQATIAAVDFKKNRATANVNHDTRGMFMSHGGVKFASEKRPYLG